MTRRVAESRPYLSVVVPVYNEERTLPRLFRALIPVLESVAGNEWEVIVSDDGSTDGSAEIAARTGPDDRVRLLRLGRNRGKGAALRAGFAETAGEFVLFCDADMATPPETVVPFLKALEDGAQIAIGNRKSVESTVSRPQPFLRRVFGWSFARLSNRVTGNSFRDLNCGFKLFRGDVGRELMGDSRVDGWAIDVEVLALATIRGYKVAELPVSWRDGGTSSVRLPSAVAGTLLELARIRMRLGRP